MTVPIILPKGRTDAHKVTRFIDNLSTDLAWEVTVREHKPRRSEQQNRYLWGVCYATILRDGGEAMRGWRDTDLHEFFLGEWSGWETVEAFGKRRQRPVRRSSRLNKQEFSDFIAIIHQRAAEFGIVIPDPEQYLAAA